MSKMKRRPKKFVRKIISIFFISIALYLFIGVANQVRSTVLLQQQAELAAAELASLQEENASLINRRNKLEDPNYVQTYARGEYMFSKSDEKIFYLPETEENKDE